MITVKGRDDYDLEHHHGTSGNCSTLEMLNFDLQTSVTHTVVAVDYIVPKIHDKTSSFLSLVDNHMDKVKTSVEIASY